MGMAQTGPEASGIAFQTFAMVYQVFQDGVNILLVGRVGVVPVLVGAVADDIVQVSQDIVALQAADPVEGYLKIMGVGLPLCTVLVKGRIVGILSLDIMVGADDEIYREGRGQLLQIVSDMKLKPQLDAGADMDSSGIFLTYGFYGREIGIQIQKKGISCLQGVIIMVIGNTDLLHAKGNGPLGLVSDRSL